MTNPVGQHGSAITSSLLAILFMFAASTLQAQDRYDETVLSDWYRIITLPQVTRHGTGSGLPPNRTITVHRRGGPGNYLTMLSGGQLLQFHTDSTGAITDATKPPIAITYDVGNDCTAAVLEYCTGEVANWSGTDGDTGQIAAFAEDGVDRIPCWGGRGITWARRILAPGTPDPGPVPTDNPITFEYVMAKGAPDENQTKECDAKTGCTTCSTGAMASYSIHLLLASLHIEDTPVSYNSPRGPSANFKVTYNQREANQPTAFSYSNLGPKWTFNWLSYVTDNGPAVASAYPAVYLRGGGTAVYKGFNSSTQSYAPDGQTLATLVRISDSVYERRFPDGAKEVFSESDGSMSFPRRIFLRSVVDGAGDAITLTYNGLRIATITDSLGWSTKFSYEEAGDPLKISKVTDPLGRFATFEYTSGRLTKITDPVGIESQFQYESGSDFIGTMTTPYGPTTFTKGETGTSVRWLEATDPRGGKERVEYNEAVSSIPTAEDSAPAGVHNSGLELRNTFYWDKKAMADAPGDYTKAQIFHWLATPEGKVSGVKHSEKKALENRIWYTYPDQTEPTEIGSIARPATIARLLDGGATQLSQFKYNALGNLLKETDPVDRVTSYVYDANDIDVVEVYQRNPLGASMDPDEYPADKVASTTYNALHQPLVATDAGGQPTTYTYTATSHQLETVTNARFEQTTYVYGNGSPGQPIGYLTAIIGPQIGQFSPFTSFVYDDDTRQLSAVTTGHDNYTVAISYDNLDRPTQVTYPDGTNEQFQYTDSVRGMTLDLTASKDRRNRWTYRHYNANRQMDSITDPENRTTHYDWCICGSLTSITDPNQNITTFNRDLQSRVYQKVFADTTTINFLYEGQTAPNTVGKTSRLISAADALNRRTNYFYFPDDRLSGRTYTNTSGGALSPPTPSVGYLYDENYDRLRKVLVDSVVQTEYEYYTIALSASPNAGRLQTVDGPLADDTISYTYDELGRTHTQSVNGVIETVDYDPLGRPTTTDNALGHFSRVYDGVTSRLQTLEYPTGTGQSANYTYLGNNDDRRLQTLQNLASGSVNLSKFDYTYDDEGQITSWSSLLGAVTSGRWFEHDDARQLLSARNASNPGSATQVNGYVYDDGGNRTADSNFNPQTGNGTFHDYTLNNLNQIENVITTEGMLNWEAPWLHDLAGNLTDDGAGRTFEWDAVNRLRAINDGSARSEFTYDGLGRRVKIVEKAGSTVTSTKQFVWAGNTIAQERDANNVITRSYFAEGEERGSPGARGTRQYYYSRDHLGSIREMTDSTGALQARYDYDPYGHRTKLSGSLDVDFGYTGHYHHVPSGLNLTLYRAYNPAVGRWISRDPIAEEGGLNLYQYVFNNPTQWKDALGLECNGEVFMGHNKSSPTGAHADWQTRQQQQNPTKCYYLTCGGNVYNREQGFNPGQNGPNCNNHYELGRWWYSPENSTADIRAAANAVGKKVCSENRCCQEVAVKVKCDPKWTSQALGDAIDTSLCGRTLYIKCNSK